MATIHTDLERLRRSMNTMFDIQDSSLQSMLAAIRESRDELRQAFHAIKEGLREDFREFRAGIDQEREVEVDSPKHQLDSQILNPICSEKPTVDSKIEASPGMRFKFSGVTRLAKHDFPRVVDDIVELAFDGCTGNTQLFFPEGIDVSRSELLCLFDTQLHYSIVGFVVGMERFSGLSQANRVWKPGGTNLGMKLDVDKYDLQTVKLAVFKRMKQESNLKPDESMIVSTLSACSALKNLEIGESIHRYVATEFEISVKIGNSLVDMFCKCGCLDKARVIFDSMRSKNVKCWTSMVSGYVSNGKSDVARELFERSPVKDVLWTAMMNGYVQFNRFDEALELFRCMQTERIKLDNFVLVSLLQGWAQTRALEQGKWIHGYIYENKVTIDKVVGTTLVDMYAKCDCIETTLEVFYETEKEIFDAISEDSKGQISTAQVLEHPWLREGGETSDKTIESVVLSRMKQFRAMNKLQKLALKVIAENIDTEEIQGLKAMFANIKTDNSGTITYEELKEGLAKLGSKLTEAEVKQLMDAADVDGNGSIDYMEFITATMKLFDCKHHKRKYAVGNVFEAINVLKKSGFKPKRSLEIILLTSGEPTRFGISCLGSRLLAGSKELAEASQTTVFDTQNVSFIEAAKSAGYAEDKYGDLSSVFLKKGCYVAFIELHIEQRPILEEEEGLDIGGVTAIAAPASLKVEFEGNRGHAGAVLMLYSNDAGLAAAELASAIAKQSRNSFRPNRVWDPGGFSLKLKPHGSFSLTDYNGS